MIDIVRWATSAALSLSLLLPVALPAGAADGDTLKAVRERGQLNCGIGGIGTGQNFRRPEDGRWIGFYPDVCRAIAAAALGRSEDVAFIPTEATNWVEALKSGAIDVLVDGRTWTFRRDAGSGLDFAGIYLYDGQGFLARRSLGAGRLSDVGKARICVAAQTTTEANLIDLKAARGAAFELVTFQAWDESVAGLFKGRCDILSSDRLLLVTALERRATDRDAFVLLPDVISREPLGPVVRTGDETWFDLVKWTLHALVVAEEKGVTAAVARENRPSADPEARRLLGQEGGVGAPLGLPDHWARDVIAAVGHYGEVYGRNLGKDSLLGLARGPNALWIDGGLIYAPPFR